MFIFIVGVDFAAFPLTIGICGIPFNFRFFNDGIELLLLLLFMLAFEQSFCLFRNGSLKSGISGIRGIFALKTFKFLTRPDRDLIDFLVPLSE